MFFIVLMLNNHFLVFL